MDNPNMAHIEFAITLNGTTTTTNFDMNLNGKENPTITINDNGSIGHATTQAQMEATRQQFQGRHNPNPGTISQAQINGLHAFTVRNGQDLEEVAQRKFGVSVENMSSKQADELFGIFRNGRA